jgi:glycosyltransferase involved in cell wall biosynthesis
MHLVDDSAECAVEVENTGVGRIVWVPVDILEASSRIGGLGKRVQFGYHRTLRVRQQEGMPPGRAICSSVGDTMRHLAEYVHYTTVVLSNRLHTLLATFSVELLAVHWVCYDTGALIRSACRSGIPFVLINHFDNGRLLYPETRKWVSRAAGVGGVSGQNVPEQYQDRFVNLSDAVDIEFFCPAKARAQHPSPAPILLLPARIGPGKGHCDAVEVVRILKAGGVQVLLCCPGAAGSVRTNRELTAWTRSRGVNDSVLLPGEMSPEELRDWYAMSDVVILPSYSEGLGRVLLEAQAMERPVVAYETGGTREAVLAGETGFLVSPGDIATFADRVRFLLTDGAARRGMGEQGRRFVARQFGVTALVQRHEMFYARAISQR